ncbi:MAG: thioredoxin family protein [Bacteroidales bacterium]|nr:thioredoxin family protein [Bacteroidales bacterium]
MLRKLIISAGLLLSGIFVSAQMPETTATWKYEVEVRQDTAIVTFTGKMAEGWHLNPAVSEDDALSVQADNTENCTEVGQNRPDSLVIVKKYLVEDGASVSGKVRWMACSHGACAPPEEWEFNIVLTQGKASWGLVLEAILWGFLMLLTPCVFPMVPMTVSFFMRETGGKAKAMLYGLFIVLLYTVPISIIVMLTRMIGGEVVTADIFNWLATHWLPNIIFFIVFMVFAASFFGAFEITLPSSLVNSSDKNADRGGIIGVFFIALTLVLVSFSCTGPIVGTVLIKSTQGDFWTPMITMLAFSTAFALPFTILALFPSLMKKLPKSGNWLGMVKVCLGYIEVALGLKFLSVADQTYHWGILPREVYIGIWIVVFFQMGSYLLKNRKYILSVLVYAFVLYLFTGLAGNPLKAISGYLPPMKTVTVSEVRTSSDGPDLDLALGLRGYSTIEAGVEAAKKEGKPVFVDITGHGCVNCREMEARVWSDSTVLRMLKDDYVIVALYMDDKTKVGDGQDVGRINSEIARKRFGVNAQPNYILLSPEGEQKIPVRGYNLSVPGFIEFLEKGLSTYRTQD